MNEKENNNIFIMMLKQIPHINKFSKEIGGGFWWRNGRK